jgi:nascent polypeptide-associated complex subunit alpha
MMDKMGLDMNELSNVQEVIIKTDKKAQMRIFN